MWWWTSWYESSMHEKDYEYFITSLSRMCDIALFSIEHLVVRHKIIFLKPKVRIVLHQDKVHLCVFPFSSSLFFSFKKCFHCDTINYLVPSCVSFTLIPTNFMSFFPHYIHKLPFWSCPQPPGCFAPTSASLYQYKHSFTYEKIQAYHSGLPDFIYKTSNMICPSDVLNPNTIHPQHFQREPLHILVFF